MAKPIWPYRMQPGSQVVLSQAMSVGQKKYRNIGYGGPKGGGKSFGARAVAFTLTYDIPIVVTLIRSRLNVLKVNHIIPAKSELKPFMEMGLIKYRDQDKMFEMPSGGIVRFMHCERESDIEQFDGIASDVYMFEEAGHFTEHMIKGILKNNRSSDIAIQKQAQYQPRALFTFNWGGKGHSYLRRVFWDKHFDGEEKPDEYLFIFAAMHQNKALLKADPEYQQRLMDLPEQLKNAYLKGDPDAFAGTMFTIMEDVHEVDPTTLLAPYGGTIPDHWDIVGSLDSATGGTCSFGLYAISPEGKKYKMFNYYIKGRNPKQHVEAICDAIESPNSVLYGWTKGRGPSYIVSDPYAFAQKERLAILSNKYTWEDLFLDRGYYLHKVKYNRVTAITALQTALHFEFERGKLVVQPDLIFFKGMCGPTIEELKAIERDKTNPEDCAHDPHIPDDAIDETKNFIMTAGNPPPLTNRPEGRTQDAYGSYGSSFTHEPTEATLDDSFGVGTLDDLL